MIIGERLKAKMDGKDRETEGYRVGGNEEEI